MAPELRKLSAYLSRRRVKSVSDWLSESGITSIQQLQEFCDASLLRVDLELYRDHFKKPTVSENSKDQVAKKPTKSRAKKTSASDESWHVPAAERPLKGKSKPKKKAATRSKRKRS